MYRHFDIVLVNTLGMGFIAIVTKDHWVMLPKGKSSFGHEELCLVAAVGGGSVVKEQRIPTIVWIELKEVGT